MSDRIIGRKAILGMFEQMYDISSWTGALKFISNYHLPPAPNTIREPMFLRHELVEFDSKYQEKS